MGAKGGGKPKGGPKGQSKGGKAKGGKGGGGGGKGGGKGGGFSGKTGQPSQGSKGGKSGPSGKSGGVAASEDHRLFIGKLARTRADRLGQEILGAGKLWADCWDAAQRLDAQAVQSLIFVIGKLPPSANPPAPPAHASMKVMKKYLQLEKGNPEQAVKAVEVCENVVKRLLGLEWDVKEEEVRDALQSMLEEADGCLQIRQKDHKEAKKRIMDLMDHVEKPWCIKLKKADAPQEFEAPSAATNSSDWRHATVLWLCKAELFAPPMLPKMRGGKGKGVDTRGIYDSPDQYMETIQQLMVTMTFSDGNASVSPKCWHKDYSGKDCGAPLWPIPEGQGLECRSRRCSGAVVLACSNRNHNSGLCKRCAHEAHVNLLGRAGRGASTHIYDVCLSHIGADGKLYFKGLASRSPPQMPIHWRTTKRLQSPNLVGLVKLSEQGAALKLSDRIYWGEISSHPSQGGKGGKGKPSDESLKRQGGFLAVNLASVIEFDADFFAEGDHVAVIDCMTFVPEYIPVLKALEMQRGNALPFENGALLNLCSWHQPDLSNTLAEDEDMSRLKPLVDGLIEESTLQPIVEIRRHEALADACADKILKLLKAVTLDPGQLRSFIDGLRNPMHLTQGPPGTGKSYLGVVMVRALLIIREFWVQVNPSVGTPPILVLSYKNHAIDEFLVDLVKAEPKLGNKPDMIRIGGGASLDQRLYHFSERNLGRQDPEVWNLKVTVQWLHDLSSAFKAISQTSSSFSGYQADMFKIVAGESEATAHKKRMRSAYQATEMLLDTVIRTRILSDQLEEEEDDDDNDLASCKDDMDIFNELDFIRKDFEHKRGYKTQSKLETWEVFEEIWKLREGIDHYLELGHDRFQDPGEVLFLFLRGWQPYPLCTQCNALACDVQVALCERHRCTFELENWSQCPEPVLPGRRGCRHHACGQADCEIRKLPGEDFCQAHACFVCIEQGLHALQAMDEPPRNTCEKHVLCWRCDKLALDGKEVCQEHDFTQCRATLEGVRCRWPAVSSVIPYCREHLPFQPRRWQTFFGVGAGWSPAEPINEDSDGEAREESEPATCIGTNRKGTRCGTRAMKGSKFCHIHAPPKESLAQMREAEPVPVTAPEAKQSFYDADATDTGPNGNIEEADEDFASAGSEHEQPQVDEADGRYDNQDEVEEADHLQHLREVYDFQEWSDESSSEDLEEEGGVPTFDANPEDAAAPQSPKEWTWEMPLQERWEACQMLMSQQRDLLTQVLLKIKDQSWIHRKKLRQAEIRASARVYENKSIIGGTIVGCISRLEAIRSTRPFAVVVEEASEVLEPLLFSCFVSSTVKLEMIGDHLQLQPSIMQKFAFERMNNVNLSMFERLIRAPVDHKAPSSVLAVQRRMRKDVCDLTREYYDDITAIEDHETCWTKKIPGKVAASSFYKGREVPGVASHIFLWTHSGSQGKAEVGLSKINRQEADMAVWLAYYLVQCGVPKPSIVILTPYKGQLMLIRKQLLSDRSSTWLLSGNPADADQIRLSTVDRFQGDEGDVVIASLVVDEHSKTPFVKLQNRMIVLLSRARLGMYILGNTGYFENSKPEKHWQRTFEILQELVATPDSQGATKVPFTEPRVGGSLPLCCGQHPTSTFSAEKAKDLALGFCKTKCEEQLSCTHPCGLQCHWPQKQHNSKCQATVASPCARHSAGLPCHDVFANSKAAPDDTIDEALRSYRCPVKVTLLLPCSHEPDMLCADEEDIQRGKKPMPDCHQPSHTPYVYPACKHTREVTCFELSQYRDFPNKVPLCEHMVEYLPSCGHSISVKCSLKSAYQQSAARFVCPKKLEIDLPRCGHRAKVSCAVELTLRGWAGGRCSEKDIVREGQDYGALDHVCSNLVTFIRRCGHEEKVKCGKAFDLANVRSHCNEQVPIVHPHCGHECKTPCHQSQQYADLPRPDKSIDNLEESELAASPAPMPGLTCNAQVLVKRNCGHEIKIACKLKTSSLPPCKENCVIVSTLCGHDVSVPCHEVDAMRRWKPWDQEVTEHLRREGELPAGAKPQEISTPQDLLNHAKTCKKTLRVIRTCGHPAQYDCKELAKILKDGQIKGQCYEKVERPLNCGHMAMAKCHEHQKYSEGKGGITCKEKATRECWNSSTCGSRRLLVQCSSTAKVCCDKESTWQCPEKRHSYKLKLCHDGSPTTCPGCQEDKMNGEMEAIQKSLEDDLPLNSTLHECFLETQKTVLGFTKTACFAEERCELNPSAGDFRSAQLELLQAFKQKQENEPLWSRTSFEPKLVPVFCLLPKNQKFQGFSIRKQFRADTLEGIQVHRLTKENLLGLDTEDTQLIFGLVYTLNGCKGNWPGNKKNEKKKALNDWRSKGMDCFEAKDAKFPQRFVVWRPFAMVMTHGLRLSKQSRAKAAALLQSQVVQDLLPKQITLEKPPFKVTPASAAPELHAESDERYVHLEELQETPAADFVFPAEWNGALVTGAADLSERHGAELKQKLSFMNSSAVPFAGKNLLDQLRASCTSELLDLLSSLELLGTDTERSSEYLEKYMRAVKVSARREAHPLLLLAMWRSEAASSRSKSPVLVALQRYPALDALLTETEKAQLEGGPSFSPAVEPAEQWEEMKETKGCSSEAMDKLMSLTGLKKVKATAVALYKSALQFQQMSPEIRKANSMALNYCFLGNPGTGKTTVARLFAAILHDSELRSQNVFQECGAQKVKDDGIDEFRKLAQGAMDGVLFIDEAYDLDPMGDKFKGAPIVNELVTLTENERARLTCILAGYEDDMNNKLFAYNTGLKSRFQEVIFEDFDETELSQIWVQNMSERGWKEEDSRLTSVAVRRILKSRGKKGFGNAREVRKKIESATAAAMSREDFSPSEMLLRFADVVGEDPRSNPKLKAVLDKINDKIGWKKIKEAVKDLVTVCGTNYQRELDGQAPLPVFLNRLFLGNPGTGKTTCAKLYGEVLKHLGFLSSGEVVFKTAGDLGGSVVGEAQQKVLSVLQSAAGKVLVVDEAYNLDDSLYGKQVLDVLVEKIQGTENDDIAVLLLGYEDPMSAMLRNQNPGLARRFPLEMAFRFEDYTDQELMQILRLNCKQKELRVSVEFQEKALRKLDMLRRSSSNFGNAGAVENLLKSAMLKASARGGNDLSLVPDDIDVGPEADMQEDPFAPLEKLYRMEKVKSKLQQMSKAFTVAQQEGSEVPELGHFVFSGAPGTGKTTVARVMSRILFQLRLLGRDHVEETSGLNLTGEFVGQTKKKVEEQLDAAKGGVLFIDEAYELGKGPFGAEACTSIVAAMTDPKYRGVVIIMAGYPGDMNKMLDTNPGLKSRFTHFIEFEDWSPEDCLHLFRKRAATENFTLQEAAELELKDGFSTLLPLDGWGNARDVDKVWRASLQERADRVVQSPEGLEKTIQECDVKPAITKLIEARKVNAAPTMPSFPWENLPMEMQKPRTQETLAQDLKLAQTESIEEADEQPPAVEERDAGVSDEIWAELQRAKEAMAQEEARLLKEQQLIEERAREEAARREEELRREMEEYLRRLAEEKEQARLEEERRRLQAELEARLERERQERERRRLEEIERLRAEQAKRQAIQQKLQQISPCPAGFNWYKCGGGWRCGGGSHFVSDEQLRRQFAH